MAKVSSGAGKTRVSRRVPRDEIRAIGTGAFNMSNDQSQQPTSAQMLEVQAALFNLRDGLMNLKMSLQELAFMSDEGAQAQAREAANDLLSRLRG